MKFNTHAIAIMAGGMLLASSALAADLGGTCCADLDERVAELEATTARKGNRKVSLTVSGHVNQAIIWYDAPDLGDSDFHIGENSNSLSRFRFHGAAVINKEWSAGFLMEIGVGNAGEIDTRHNAVYLRSQQLGTFWLGKTSQATDGIIEMSLSQANEALTLGSLGQFGSIISSTDLLPGPVRASISPDNPFDGGRSDVVRWVSPVVAGFTISASVNDGEEWDVAMRYAGEFGDIRIAAGAGYRDEEQTDGRRFYGGSTSVMHMPSGIFVDGMYGRSDGIQTVDVIVGIGGVNATFAIPLCDCVVDIWGGRIGIEKSMSAAGKTTLAAHYERLDVKAGTNIDMTRYGFSAVQAIDAAAMQLYFDYSHYDAGSGTGLQDADVVTAGAKIKF